jgi:hypothetical protein
MQQSKLTSGGRDWLVSCLDPFHDYQQTIAGFPDLNGGISTCQMYSETLTISAPAGVAGNWDCQVIYTGTDSRRTCTLAPGLSNLCRYESDVLYGYTLAPVTCIASPAGTSAKIDADPATCPRHCLHSRAAQNYDFGRLIAVGIEVTNSTSELYKQGRVTTALVPMQTTHQGMVAYHDVAVPAQWNGGYLPMQNNFLTRFTETESDVRLIPGSQQWAAAQGVYMIPRLANYDLPINGGVNDTVSSLPGPAAALSVPTWGPANPGAGVYTSVYHQEPDFEVAFPTSGVLIPGFSGIWKSSFQPCTAYFAGLSNQTTLTVTVRSVVEYFPADETLLPFAKPSTFYDLAALKTYAAAARAAPWSVPVSMNAKGDYFRMVLKAIKNASPMLTLVPGFGKAAPIVAGLASAGEMLVDRLYQEDKPKRKGKVVVTGGVKVRPNVAGMTARPIK